MTDAEKAREEMMQFNSIPGLVPGDKEWVKARAEQAASMSGETKRQFINTTPDAYHAEFDREPPRGLVLFLICAAPLTPQPTPTEGTT